MRMHEIVILGLIMTVIARQWLRDERPPARWMDAELRRLLARGTIELVQERLARVPLPVRVVTGHGLRGSFVCLDGPDLTVRLRLYHPAPVFGAGDATGRLTGLRWAGGRGWVAQVETAGGSWSLLGWHVDIRHGPVSRAGSPRP